MKKTAIFIVLLIWVFQLSAQERKPFPISVAYFTPYGIQPGGKISTSFDLQNWGFEEPNTAQTISWLAQPGLGYFNRPRNHSNIIAQVDFGRKKRKDGKSKYTMPSIGLGYVSSFEILTNSVNLGSGEISKGDTRRIGYFLPTINYEWGRDIFERMGWHLKLSYGRKISTAVEDSAFFAVEIGAKFKL